MMKRIEKVLDEMNIKYEINKDNALIEFWTDTAGQDIPVEIDYDGTVENLVVKFATYAENYNVDDEVECYINMRGENGIPSSVRDLIDDCQEAKDTLMKIANKLKNAISDTYLVHFKVESTYIVAVNARSIEEAKEKGEYEFSGADFGVSEDINGEIVFVEKEN